MPVPVGLNVWSRLVAHTFPYLDATRDGFDSLWFPDHVQYGSHAVAEGWSLLAYALARYPEHRCGHAVLCNSFRNPAQLAKMAATLQALSGGRLILGIGAGWNEEEYHAYGWPFPNAPTRIAQLAEAVTLIRTMWRDAPASFAGEHYRIEGAYCEPRPEPAPPIVIGGHGERFLLRVVAEHADGWNLVYRGRAYYARKQTALRRHCDALGRDYAEIEQTVHCGVLIAETPRALTALKARDDVRPPNEETIVGTPDQVTEALLEAVEQGAGRFTLHFCDAPRVEGTRLFAQTVLPRLAAL